MKSGYLGIVEGFGFYVHVTQYFDQESINFSHQMLLGLTKSDLESNDYYYNVLTPRFEFETIIALTFIQDQL
ncbi:hypothetical protein FJ364_04805 [Candidatus Dependentiae bacterium]|nr:hypothetical protein [Candidatus Dependentiae bacterium]